MKANEPEKWEKAQLKAQRVKTEEEIAEEGKKSGLTPQQIQDQIIIQRRREKEMGGLSDKTTQERDDYLMGVRQKAELAEESKMTPAELEKKRASQMDSAVKEMADAGKSFVASAEIVKEAAEEMGAAGRKYVPPTPPPAPVAAEPPKRPGFVNIYAETPPTPPKPPKPEGGGGSDDDNQDFSGSAGALT